MINRKLVKLSRMMAMTFKEEKNDNKSQRCSNLFSQNLKIP